jgi:hypothetical protein
MIRLVKPAIITSWSRLCAIGTASRAARRSPRCCLSCRRAPGCRCCGAGAGRAVGRSGPRTGRPELPGYPRGVPTGWRGTGRQPRPRTAFLLTVPPRRGPHCSQGLGPGKLTIGTVGAALSTSEQMRWRPWRRSRTIRPRPQHRVIPPTLYKVSSGAPEARHRSSRHFPRQPSSAGRRVAARV